MSYNTLSKTFTGEAAVAVQCPSCFLEFAIPSSLSEAYWQKRTVPHLYCPSCGNTMIPADKSEAEKLRDELTREKQRTEQAQADAEFMRNRITMKNRQLAARKGQLARIKNRVKNGVCPACTRTFENLARHMASQHPHYCEAEK